MTDAIRTESLGKTYPDGTSALTGVGLVVRPGEIFGFLGPNGAGKTTAISILTTVLRPTEGWAEIDGVDVVRAPERVRRRIGLVFQRSSADETLTGRENLEIVAGLYGLSPRGARPRIRELLAQFDLADAAEKPVRGYSGGMRRRLEIAAGIVHEPRILFLDEPTLGLDPQGRAQFWEYLRDLRRRQQLTIFLTTHYLDEADQLADRVSIIDRGSLVATGTPGELKERLGGDVVEVRVRGPAGGRAPRVLQDVPGVVAVRPNGEPDAYRLSVSRSDSIVPAIVRSCDAAGIELTGVSTRRPSLDQVFLAMTGRAYHETDGEPPEAAPRSGTGGPGGR
jgi:ABC-2 type transport system ATP-binding protein